MKYINLALSLKSTLIYKTLYVSPSKVSDEHLHFMLDSIIDNVYIWEEDKINRWIGFVQGVMVAHGFTTIDEERERVKEFLN